MRRFVHNVRFVRQRQINSDRESRDTHTTVFRRRIKSIKSPIKSLATAVLSGPKLQSESSARPDTKSTNSPRERRNRQPLRTLESFQKSRVSEPPMTHRFHSSSAASIHSHASTFDQWRPWACRNSKISQFRGDQDAHRPALKCAGSGFVPIYPN